MRRVEGRGTKPNSERKGLPSGWSISIYMDSKHAWQIIFWNDLGNRQWACTIAAALYLASWAARMPPNGPIEYAAMLTGLCLRVSRGFEDSIGVDIPAHIKRKSSQQGFECGFYCSSIDVLKCDCDVDICARLNDAESQKPRQRVSIAVRNFFCKNPESFCNKVNIAPFSSYPYQNCLDNAKTVRTVKKLSGQFRNCPENSETIRTL